MKIFKLCVGRWGGGEGCVCVYACMCGVCVCVVWWWYVCVCMCVYVCFNWLYSGDKMRFDVRRSRL